MMVFISIRKVCSFRIFSPQLWLGTSSVTIKPRSDLVYFTFLVCLTQICLCFQKWNDVKSLLRSEIHKYFSKARGYLFVDFFQSYALLIVYVRVMHALLFWRFNSREQTFFKQTIVEKFDLPLNSHVFNHLPFRLCVLTLSKHFLSQKLICFSSWKYLKNLNFDKLPGKNLVKFTFNLVNITKGQLISIGLVGILNPSKKRTKKSF